VTPYLNLDKSNRVVESKMKKGTIKEMKTNLDFIKDKISFIGLSLDLPRLMQKVYYDKKVLTLFCVLQSKTASQFLTTF
jgi:hypothetical protein